MGSRKRLIIALVLSLLLHLGLGWRVLRTVGQIAHPPEQVVELLFPETIGRIADLTQPANRIRPQRARAVGVEHNTTSEETVATTQRRRPASARAMAGRQSPASRLKSDAFENPSGASAFAMREPVAARPRLPQTAVSTDLSQGLIAHIPEDYFPDYTHGGHTYINVLKRPGIDYFVRLKRTFRMAWDPVPALRAQTMANAVSRGSMKVVLGLGVDATGNLDELFILKGSGLARYDQEALRAVRASAPFTSPPAPLLAGDRFLRMSWTFIVYL